MASLIGLLVMGAAIYLNYTLAKKKNRNVVLWCILGFLFGLLSTIVIALLSEKEAETEIVSEPETKSIESSEEETVKTVEVEEVPETEKKYDTPDID